VLCKLFVPQSWLLLALFFGFHALASPANSHLKLAESTHWQLLLHSNAGQPQITQPDFLLTAKAFSPQAELLATLALYQQDPVQTFCRFPARITFLADQLHLPLADDRFARCPALQHYLAQVPFDQLSLIYASEVLSSASSMMGHIFLRAAGKNQQQHDVAHSLAYFTEITSFNPLQLMYDGTIGGMPGFFMVRPFQYDLVQYQQREGRNLWQFELNTTPAQRELLRLHLWELRELDITYYFQSFNCATLTLELLALLDPTVLRDRSLFVSPQDVVKAASRHQLVNHTEVHPATAWWVRALGQQLNQQQKSAVMHDLQHQQISKTPLNEPLANAYLKVAAEQMWQTHRITEQRYQQIQAATAAMTEQLDLTQYKHPALTPQDSLLMLSSSFSDGEHISQLGWLAAGHLLNSDNRQYLAESELKIGYIAASLNHQLHHWQLDELTLYAVRSLTPSDDLVPAWSGEAYFGWRQIPALVFADDLPQLQTRGALEASGAFGKTLQPQRDLSLYWLIGAGISQSQAHNKLFAQTAAGLNVALVFNSKLNAEYQRQSSRLAGQSSSAQWSVTFSWFARQDLSVQLRWQQNQVNNLFGTQQRQQTGLALLHYF